MKSYCQKLEAHRYKWPATVKMENQFWKEHENGFVSSEQKLRDEKVNQVNGCQQDRESYRRTSKASGGVTKIVEAYEQQVNIQPKSAMHSHKSFTNDETVINADLRSVRPFQKQDGKAFRSFVNTSTNPTSSFDQAKFNT